jgi:putative ABC transport system ATP-binding protein
MHILAGLDFPTSGWVAIGGTRLDDLNDRELTMLRRRDVGFIFQSYTLLPTLDAEQNIVLPVRIGGGHVDREWLDTLVATFRLEDRLSHRPSELSGGQQQRVAVARALVTRPAVVFADEPTGNLDSKASQDVLELLRRAVDELGQTIVMVTHDAHAAAMADAVLFLADGRIVERDEHLSEADIYDRVKGLAE